MKEIQVVQNYAGHGTQEKKPWGGEEHLQGKLIHDIPTIKKV